MDYQFRKIEQDWQRYWAENKVFKTENKSNKPKFYVLDMFPYPSGAGLHVGHPLGYIATDIFSRYKRLKGYNVLHPMGYDSFGLPAEQYAIQTGQHPAVTTAQNVARYREQLDRVGFSFDWDREVKTSDPAYYRWTQWIFGELFNSWYNNESDKAEDINLLVSKFSKEGNANVNAVQHEQDIFTADEWNSFSEEKQQNILLNYRLAYLADSWVNWCPALGTVLANDEVKDGYSERGGYPVEQKLMRQWSMRITAFADRLINGLDSVDWPDAVKEMQRNWIGKSKGSSLKFGLTLNPSPKERDFKDSVGEPSPKERDFKDSVGEPSPKERDFKDSVGEPSPKERDLNEPILGYTNKPGYLLGDLSIWDKLKDFARSNRTNQTKAELLLWEEIRNNKIGFKIRRQHPIGKFIADFICISYKIIIEVDGGIHNEFEQKQYDEMRTFVLNELGFDVIRFSNDEIENNISKVINEVKSKLESRSSELGLNILSDIDESENYGNSNPSPLERGRGEANVIEVFTTRPDTVFGVSFLVLAPEHELVDQFTTAEYKEAIEAYKKASAVKSERDRMSDVKTITGQFTGGYVKHPFSGVDIPVWIGDYVLASYGTGAVMAVPAHDTRDYAFAKHFNLPITQVVEGGDISVEAYDAKEGKLINSDFLNGLDVKEAMQKCIEEIEKGNLGKGKINYRLRDAVFGRQRYWGEPIPVYYKNGMPYLVDSDKLPLELPPVDKFLPTESGEPPLARATDWKYENQYEYELTTMPGWAGSSWYFLRYMDPLNSNEFASREALDYWNQVDLYIGGAEHATGHLLYSRFWNKFLKDKGYLNFEEPFQKLINQGMIQGRSSFVYRINGTNKFVSFDLRKEYQTTALHVDVNIVSNDILDIEKFKVSLPEYHDAEFVLSDGKYLCGFEVEKMSKSKYNVVNPDDIIERYGADTLRMYEMFLGPLEQSKPWNTNGIEGVFKFLRKYWKLFHNDNFDFVVSDETPTKEEYKSLHKIIKKVQDDVEKFSFNTSVSSFMICVNELMDLKCNKREILRELTITLSPYAPHITEECWKLLGEKESITFATYPIFKEEYMVESEFSYPISFNGKTRTNISMPVDISETDAKALVLANADVIKQLEGKELKKFIFVKGRIVNIVC